MRAIQLIEDVIFVVHLKSYLSQISLGECLLCCKCLIVIGVHVSYIFVKLLVRILKERFEIKKMAPKSPKRR